jgi:molecular chaperone GrpE
VEQNLKDNVVEEVLESEKEEEGNNDVVSKLEDEIKQLKDSILREKAENENLRRRAHKEIDEAGKYAVTSFARDLIEVLENMQRAVDSLSQVATEIEEIKKVLDGVVLTKDSLTSVFDKYGIIRIYPLNEHFDHNLHQAIIQVETDEQPEGMCVQVIQSGYTIKERLLRPALVAVSKGKSS